MTTVLLRVDPDLPLPVYEQLRAQVARLAASGQVRAETRLPTIRQLAADLGLAKGTIERAYLLLEADGIVQTRGRAGTFVVGRPEPGTHDGAAGAAELTAAAEALAVVARQLGTTDADAVAALRAALTRLG